MFKTIEASPPPFGARCYGAGFVDAGSVVEDVWDQAQSQAPTRKTDGSVSAALQAASETLGRMIVDILDIMDIF